MKKNNYIILGILSFIFIALVFIYTGFNDVYGSMTDWVMQHTVIPDYFRTLFYETGNISPNLALNVGAGQNAYYLSYYGLLNPFVLISYLFPFIKMIDYMIIISIVIVIASSFLIYKWLCNNNIDSKIAFISSILFMLMNAFFHAHRHIMFVNYLPFLILGLIGIDKYFKEKKSGIYIISVFLMIMTSYYYSVGGLLCLLIYGIYKYIKINNKITIKSFLKEGILFLIPMFIGILMSFILLVPTLLAILSSRSGISKTLSLGELLIPNFNFNTMLYDNYGIGFTAISIIGLINGVICLKRDKKFLSICLLIIFSIPLFMYILNGMLYLRSKIFIPLSPIVIFLTSLFLNDLKNKKITIKKYMIVLIVVLIMAIVFKYNETYFYFDLALTSIGIILLILKKTKIFYIILIVTALFSNITVNRNENYVTKDTYNNIKSQDINNLINYTLDDKTFYRMDNLIGDTSLNVNRVYNSNYFQTSIYSSTYNSYYKDFYDDVVNNSIPYRNNLLRASTSNIMFETLMGIKYVITDIDNVPTGYEKIAGSNDLGLYKNENVFTLGYASASLMSEADFMKLKYPYTNDVLLNYIVVDKDVPYTYKGMLEKIDLSYELIGNLDIKKSDTNYIVDTIKKEKITLKLDEPFINKIIFVKFRLNKAPNCSSGDISITINNISNKLTCKQWLYFNNNYEFEYVISSPKEIEELNIIFSKGHFDISDIELHTLDYGEVLKAVSKVDKFQVDTKRTKGNIIEGRIDVEEDGYFTTTIPYDKGFTIMVDEKQIEYELVNKAFIGFPISKGTHQIKMIYNSPGYKLGAIGSLIGLFSFICVITLQNKQKTTDIKIK